MKEHALARYLFARRIRGRIRLVCLILVVWQVVMFAVMSGVSVVFTILVLGVAALCLVAAEVMVAVSRVQCVEAGVEDPDSVRP